MISMRRKILLGMRKAFDLLGLSLALLTAMIVRTDLDLDVFQRFLSIRVKVQNILIYFGILGLWLLSFQALGLYRPRRFSSLLDEIRDVLKATTIGTICLATIFIIFKVSFISLDSEVGILDS